MDKRNLTERDICSAFVPPAVKRGWDEGGGAAQIKLKGIS
jgi:hypothetical protein